MNGSRRSFLATGLALPAVASATRSEQAPQTPARPPSPAKALSSGPELRYKVLGKTGLKVTAVGFGCMVTSDGSVVERAADMQITYFDTARNYQSGNNERMVGAALKKKRKDIVLSTKTEGRKKRRRWRNWIPASQHLARTSWTSGICTARPSPRTSATASSRPSRSPRRRAKI